VPRKTKVPKNGQEDMPPLSSIAEHPSVSIIETDGHPPGEGLVGQESILVAQARKETNMVREMLTGSMLPAEYLPRTRITEQEIARYSRIQAILQPIEAGIVDLTSIIAWQCNARIGLNGLGRQEAVEMIVAEKKRQMAMSDRARYGEMPMGGKGDKNF